MALHDVDRSPNRESPMPNTHDASYIGDGFPIINRPRAAHGTTSFNPVTDATDTTSAPTFTGNFRVVKTGDISITTTSVTGSAGNYSAITDSVSVAHNLGYTPALLAYINDGGVYLPIPWTGITRSGSAAATWQEITPSVDATTLYIDATTMVYGNTSFSGSTKQIRYYLLQETAN